MVIPINKGIIWISRRMMKRPTVLTFQRPVRAPAAQTWLNTRGSVFRPHGTWYSLRATSQVLCD
jgi:hypothetical protein